ncbi:MAG: HNH endonuclease signature motif containing protein [Rhodoplanes sp.]
MTNPYYRTPEWRVLRATRLRLDGYRCAVPGCPVRASVVDHIVARRRGGGDVLGNLRSLCDAHDRMLKERPDGRRANGGLIKGCDRRGMPIDPGHWWNRG